MAQIEHFQQEINAIPYAVADRLWVKTHLDPEEENYGFQNKCGLPLEGVATFSGMGGQNQWNTQ